MILSLDPVFSRVALDHKLSLIENEGDCAKEISGVVVRLGHRVDQDFLSRFPNLKFVATVTTGLDHIDVEHCAVRGIEVISLKGQVDFLGTIRATPEHTWALLLALVRKVPWAFEAAIRADWAKEPHVGLELAGKTLGVVGYGRVGKLVSKYAQAFDMTVLAYDADRGVFEGKPDRVQSVDFESLLERSDIVSIHVPLDRTTENYFGSAHFDRMKPGAFFINTSRGALVQEASLLEALSSGKIAGAAVDVIRGEADGVEAENAILAYARSHQNLIVTPHIAGQTRSSLERTASHIAQMIVDRTGG